MWSKAYRVSGARAIRPQRWTPTGLGDGRSVPTEPTATTSTSAEPVEASDAESDPGPANRQPLEIDLEAVSREAYERGLAEGRAHADDLVASVRGRLAESVVAVSGLRQRVLDSVERDVVELALAVARRILHREVSLDPDLVMALAKVAVERLGDKTIASIALNPVDHAHVIARRSNEALRTDGVAVVADPDIPVGGSRIQSSHGTIDVSIDGQIAEVAHALLGEPGSESGGTGAALH